MKKKLLAVALISSVFVTGNARAEMKDFFKGITIFLPKALEAALTGSIAYEDNWSNQDTFKAFVQSGKAFNAVAVPLTVAGAGALLLNKYKISDERPMLKKAVKFMGGASLVLGITYAIAAGRLLYSYSS